MRALVLFAGLTAFTVSCSTGGKKESPPAAPSTESKTSTVGTPIPTPLPEKPSGKVVNCKNGLDERVIAAEPKGTGCQVLYTKSKVSIPTATSTRGTKHCEEVAERMKGNLERAGFKCE
jgi:hypothetical protein